jgi:short-subunit dehydrogenase
MATTDRTRSQADDKPGTVIIVGAGPGIGASVAKRFAEAGYTVGLMARNRQRLEVMAQELAERTGASVNTAAADATDVVAVERAVAALCADLGEPAALCFSPLPDIGLIKPVTATRPEEFMSSLQLSVAGAVAAVDAVLPSMLEAGRGSLLFTTGSAAIHPSPERAASAVTTTAATTYISLLRQAVKDAGVRVGHTVIVGPIEAGREDAHDPDDVAADIWAHHQGTNAHYPSVLRLP